jgi:hypothetical protein
MADVATSPSTADVDDEFRQAVRSYVELHDEIAEASKKMRELRKQKNQLADAILQYMQKKDIDGCKLRDGGKLIRKQTKRLGGVNKEHIMDALRETLDETKAADVLVNIFSKRPVDTKDTLRRTKTRGPRNADD